MELATKGNTNAVDKMLNGHAYARALRAHFLTQLALIIIILRKAEIDDLTIEQIACLHESVMATVLLL